MTAFDTTASLSYLIDILNDSPVPAIVCEGSDSLSRFAYFPLGSDLRISGTAVFPGSWSGVASPTENNISLGSALDAWTLDTLEAIAGHRNLAVGWDGKHAKPPEDVLLDTAEVLAQAFSSVPVAARPIFSVDAEGKPSYSSYRDGYYLHLTIDEPGTISWYSVKNGAEVFRDEVAVEGSNLETLASEILLNG